MGRQEKVIQQILSGRSDANLAFTDLCNVMLRLGFDMRTSGSHHVFRMAGVEERLNLQRDGNKAKPYQVRQVRNVILKYRLGE